MDRANPDTRVQSLDALRGAAIVWMLAFHLCFDLNHFGWLEPRQAFLSDPFWTWQRVCIVSLFMFCAGASQALVQAQGQGWPRFWRRWAQVVACAGMVSLATFVVFPLSWVSFGVLHGLALMVLLARLTAAWPSRLLMGLALLAILAPQVWQDPVFDSRWLNGVGLVTHKPVTEDYAPLLPWMGLVWLGLVLGPGLQHLHLPQLRLTRALAFLGQWPLSLYMLHQPLFWGLLLLLSR